MDTHGVPSIVAAKLVLVKLLKQLLYQRNHVNGGTLNLADGTNFPYIYLNLGKMII